MPLVNAYDISEGQPDAIAAIIGHKSISIVLVRNGTPLAAQTVRLETLAGDRQVTGPGGRTYSLDAMLLGYRGHATIADTDVQAGDTFAVDGVSLEVVAVMPAHTDCVQCYLAMRS